jgi:hypothetical protein
MHISDLTTSIFLFCLRKFVFMNNLSQTTKKAEKKITNSEKTIFLVDKLNY